MFKYKYICTTPSQAQRFGVYLLLLEPANSPTIYILDFKDASFLNDISVKIYSSVVSNVVMDCI